MRMTANTSLVLSVMFALAAWVIAAEPVSKPLLADAAAVNALTPTRIVVEPTFESVGVQVLYSGDANFNATGEIQYRAAGEDAWRTGHYLMRISDKPGGIYAKQGMDPDGKGAVNPRFATSLMYLKGNTEYEVKVTMADADGVTSQLPPAKVRTANSQTPLGGGRDYYVDPAAPAGGDGSKDRPFNTLARGFTTGEPGDTVHFAKGVYRLSSHIDSIASGSEAKYLRFLAEPGAVITSADEAISGVGKVNWEKFKLDAEGRQIYKADIADALRIMVRKTPGDPSTGYYLWGFGNETRTLTGKRVAARGTALEHLVENSTSMNDLGAYFQAQDALYVVFPKDCGNDPAKLDVQIARKSANYASDELWLKGHHAVVDGFTTEMGATIRARHSGHHYVFRRLNVYGKTGGLATGAHALVEDCRFVFNSHWDWIRSAPAKNGSRAWDKIKNGFNDTHMVQPGTHSTIRFSLISGHSNAMPYSLAECPTENVDIHHNLIRFTGDDCVEPDGPFVNGRIYDNLFVDLFNGISDAPISVGPGFVVRNVFLRYIQGAFKVRNGADGRALYYHNTCWPNENDIRPYSDNPDGQYAFAPDRDGVRWMRTRNNILVARKEAFVIGRSLPEPKRASLDFDYDLLHVLGSDQVGRIFGEQNAVKALPKFRDMAKEDLRLAEGAPGIDAGEIIKGINDEVPEPYQYKGKAPDLGAYEAGAPLPHYGPRSR